MHTSLHPEISWFAWLSVGVDLRNHQPARKKLNHGRTKLKQKLNRTVRIPFGFNFVYQKLNRIEQIKVSQNDVVLRYMHFQKSFHLILILHKLYTS